MKVVFTEHAVDRFIERRMPGASREKAVEEMKFLFSIGVPLKEKTTAGDTQMLADGVVFVLKHDGRNGTDCATVLFDQRAEDTNPLAREIAEYGREPLEPVAAPIPRRRRSRRTSRW